jgi:ribosome assembly protein YihI (activator of Der GTPase)
LPAEDEAGTLTGMEAAATVQIKLDVPGHLADLAFPEALDRRLHTLLDKQDRGEPLSEDEQVEAEALVDLAELMTLLRLRLSPQE